SYTGAMPRFSPDGAKLAYRSYGFRRMGLHVADTHGGTSRTLDSPTLHPLPDRTIVWSPDSRGILTIAGDDINRFGSFVFPVDGGEPVETGVVSLAIGFRRFQANAWIGDRLLAHIWNGSHFSLAEATISPRSWKTAAALRYITQGSGSEFGAVPSMDGRRLAFAAYTESNSAVWKIPMDVNAAKATGAPVQITAPLRSAQMPSPAAHAPALSYVSSDGPTPS